jgi:hypothetical protein
LLHFPAFILSTSREQEETIGELRMQVERLKKVVADKDSTQKDQVKTLLYRQAVLLTDI